MLNALLRFYPHHDRIEGDEQARVEKSDFRPTPEEFAVRGLFWTVGYFQPKWFLNKNIEDENQYKEEASMNSDYRPERILWLGCQIAKNGTRIGYNYSEHRFFMPDTPQSAAATPSASSEVASTTDTATLMADCEDIDEMSRASRSTTGFSEKTEGEGFRFQHSSTWESQNTDDAMDMEEGSVVTEMAGIEHSRETP
jgi:hypothetical protein